MVVRFLLAGLMTVGAAMAAESQGFDYKLLATNRTATMEKEMNEAAGAGYRYSSFIGGETSFGGHEVVVAMVRSASTSTTSLKTYRLVSAGTTGALEKKVQRAGEEGFEYKGTTVFNPAEGSHEVLVVMEGSAETAAKKYAYQFLTTSRTSTMQKELDEAGHAGFSLLGVTLSRNLVGMDQVVAILGKEGQ